MKNRVMKTVEAKRIYINSNPKPLLKKHVFIGGILGAVIYICLCGVKTLNPFNYDWILNVYHDSTLSFLGWIFYEKAPVSEGIFSCMDMSYPHRLSIIFTDVIIPFAVVLKPVLKLLLPEHTIVQYLGIWSLTCYVLQGVFAALLFYKITQNNIARLCGTIIMLFSPIMMQRLFMHNTLVAHWLIIAALCICVYRKELDRRQYLLWVLLFGMAALIHLYFVPMLAIIFASKMLYELLLKESLLPSFVTGAISLALSVGIIAALGGFSTEIVDADQAWSYTILYKYSSNLLTWIISLGNSLFLPDLPSMEEEYEGFAYLGVGMLIGILCLLVVFIVCKVKRKQIVNNKAAVLCSAICILLSIILGVGPRVTVFDRELVNIGLPSVVDYFFAIFRSIGRFIWIAYYIIIAGTISFLGNKGDVIILKNKKIKPINIILIFILIIQIMDLSPMIINKRNELINASVWQTKMTSDRWNDIKDDFDNVYIITADLTRSPRQEAYSMYMYAYNNDLKLTSSFFAHMNDTLKNESLQYYDDLVNGKAKERTLYWFENEHYYDVAVNYIHCETIDGYFVGWVE
ncbi:hypothetical protein D3Z62_21265 [Lachnospiraceae bacterium]|nr:hypothetical protein [Lachnospiraceae bacterium]